MIDIATLRGLDLALTALAMLNNVVFIMHLLKISTCLAIGGSKTWANLFYGKPLCSISEMLGVRKEDSYIRAGMLAMSPPTLRAQNSE